MGTSLLKSLFWPGGALMLASLVLIGTGIVPLSAAAVEFYFWAVFSAGLFLAWRFHSSRIFSALITLFLASRAMEFFSAGKLGISGPGRIAFEAVAFLLPLNFLLVSWVRERGLTLVALGPRLCVLLLEAVFVAVICRPDEKSAPWFLRARFVSEHLFRWTKLPQPALVLFVFAFGVLLGRVLLYHKATDIGLLWSLAVASIALQTGGVGRVATAYFGTAALVLVASLVENSYFLAYHDELTGLPGRRAFNEAILQLPECFAIAAVDIDHFKSFNDTYGHDTGDQVLRLVARRLTQVSGGGEAFRVGGEEFTILFRGKHADDVVSQAEQLRREIEISEFRARGIVDRRAVARGPERRQLAHTSKKRKAVQSGSGELSVTISIGIAGTNTGLKDVEQVILAADKALYKAKQNGRNRVETAGTQRTRRPRLKRSIA